MTGKSTTPEQTHVLGYCRYLMAHKCQQMEAQRLFITHTSYGLDGIQSIRTCWTPSIVQKSLFPSVSPALSSWLISSGCPNFNLHVKILQLAFHILRFSVCIFLFIGVQASAMKPFSIFQSWLLFRPI